ncbi:hypothetical protein ALC57_13347, partial [Trachymyrmex cornetzi]
VDGGASDGCPVGDASSMEGGPASDNGRTGVRGSAKVIGTRTKSGRKVRFPDRLQVGKCK